MKTNILKIKTILKLFLLASFSIFFITSCDDTTKDNSIELSNQFESYKLIGEYHNENLEFIYDNIKKKITENNLKNRNSNKDVQAFLTDEFIAQNVSDFAKVNNNILNLSNFNLEMKDICLSVSSTYYPINYSLRQKSASSEDFSSDLDNYNEYQKKYINMILNNDKKDVSSFQAQIDSIIVEMESDVNLKSDERDIVYLAGAIAYFSYEYWDTNTSKWETLLSYNQQNSSSTKSSKVATAMTFNWKSMWRSDVEGGVGGGIGGAIAGGTVSLGVLTVPGWVAGAAGGAIGTSAGNAVGQWLFD